MGDKALSRKMAAVEIAALANCYEPRPLTVATVYRRIYRLPNGNWHMVGCAHDYTV